MKFNFKKFFNGDKNVDLRFVDGTNLFYNHYPVLSAKKCVSSISKLQNKTYNEYKFPLCPGLFDYSQMGYVITSFADIYIKANKAGTIVSLGPNSNEVKVSITDTIISTQHSLFETTTDEQTRIMSPMLLSDFANPFQNMDHTIVDGIVKYEDNIPHNVWKLTLPYRAVGNNSNLSLLLLPPLYHHPELLNNLYVYSGVVDVGRLFSTVNFVFSINKKCEFMIPAGTPLLHVIPIVNTEINATYGACNYEAQNLLAYTKYGFNFSFFRRFHSIKKKFRISQHKNTEIVTIDVKENFKKYEAAKQKK